MVPHTPLFLLDTYLTYVTKYETDIKFCSIKILKFTCQQIIIGSSRLAGQSLYMFKLFWLRIRPRDFNSQLLCTMFSWLSAVISMASSQLEPSLSTSSHSSSTTTTSVVSPYMQMDIIMSYACPC